MLPREPANSDDPGVYLQGFGFKDSPAPSRTPWFSSQELPAPEVGLSTIGPHPGRRRAMIAVPKEIDLKGNFSWLNVEPGFP